MPENKLTGVIAAVATAVDESGAPDAARSVKLARFLLDTGCDGLNVLGTTGEATSFSLEQRKGVMSEYKKAGLPLDRLMVGTGAAATNEIAQRLALAPASVSGMVRRLAEQGLLAYERYHGVRLTESGRRAALPAAPSHGHRVQGRGRRFAGRRQRRGLR